jgi:hypothetical protein
MAEQMLDRHWGSGRARHHGLTFSLYPYLMLSPGRDKFVDGISQLKATLFKEHHQCDRGNGFRHRVNAEDGVIPHALLALEIHHAQRSVTSCHPIADNSDITTGDFLRCEVPRLQVVSEFRELLGAKTSRYRVYVHGIKKKTVSEQDQIMVLKAPPVAVKAPTD